MKYKTIIKNREMPFSFSKMTPVASMVAISLMSGTSAFAQQEQSGDESGSVLEEVVVRGIRSSLQSALDEKRSTTNLKEVIIAEDI